jgi:hypothetical protein
MVLQITTAIIAAFALLIAGMQWRTSHQRAALDLFEKRLGLYDEWRSIIGEVLRHGTAHHIVSQRFLRAIDRAEFLFGRKVYGYLEETYKDLIDLDHANTMMGSNSPNQADWIQKRHAIFAKVSKFYGRIAPLVKPYMRMHQKAPWF